MTPEGLLREVPELGIVERNEAEIIRTKVSRQESTRPVQEIASINGRLFQNSSDTITIQRMQGQP